MTTYVREDAEADEAYVLHLTPETASGIDLSTIVSATLKVLKADGTTATWTAAMTNQTTTTLTLTHLFDVLDVPKSGKYVIYARLATASGFLKSEPTTLTVKGKFEV